MTFDLFSPAANSQELLDWLRSDQETWTDVQLSVFDYVVSGEIGDVSVATGLQVRNEYYNITNKVIDAAVLWRANSYIPNTLMSISFQYRKHLNLGRGGMILCQTLEEYNTLKAMSYDGRDLSISPWPLQNINTIGYHYYMTPETAQFGLSKLPKAIDSIPKYGTYIDYPDLSKMDVFNK